MTAKQHALLDCQTKAIGRILGHLDGDHERNIVGVKQPRRKKQRGGEKGKKRKRRR